MDNFKEWLEEQGYFNVCFKNNRWCAMYRFMFSIAIVSDINMDGYENRWCYHSLGEATGALEDWDGVGEPQYWHRHVPTMRRRNENNEEIGSW